ncbi:DUF1778 domain-containing protein [Desulfobotulus mexicanus]|uniref:DUF1778 domain-containing protein n=1 Tax=Desulfobotulus mexicanus TaxID=2586642 RepID=A0A5Q4VGK2_9BACT|nr:DUF1778 domain-containing protein [Desulfobotulus mexicanus]TYT76073.1 DUF1778 domain-containing protein [Desulfobotulus mexicanus]
MPTARLDIRLDEKIKRKAEKASTLLGLKNLTEYIVKIMDENATQVLEQHKSIIVEDNIFDNFISACEKAQKPNEALSKAAVFAREKGF